MRLGRTVGVLTVALIPAGGVCAQDQARKPKAKGKPRAWQRPIQDVPGLPRVLLIGDSISIGYTAPTRKLLDGKANVHRPLVNCGPSSRGVQQVDRWLADKRLGDGKWDVIHFNWGLHDVVYMPNGKLRVPLDQYEANLRQLVQRLRKTGAKLIWASTTPVPEGGVEPPREDRDVVAYNAAAKKIMEENRVQINDLYAFARPRLEDLQVSINVHFTRKGSDALAEQVAAAVLTALAK